jgi:hypothetical protein
MGIATEFDATNILIQPEYKRLFFRCAGENKVFKYDISCYSDNGHVKIHFYFNMSDMSSIILVPISEPFWDEEVKVDCKCAKIGFKIGEKERPIMEVNWLTTHDIWVDRIVDSFREQYASYLLDQEINS